MKHKFLVFAVCIMAVLPSFAQFRVGVEAGFNLSHAIDTNKTKPGFNVGVTGDYSFNNHWYVDAALKLSSQPCGYDEEWAYYNDPETKYHSIKNSTPYYLTLPVRAGYKFALSSKTQMSVAVGPMIGVGLFTHGTFQDENLKINLKENSFDTFSTSRFEYGANARVGFEFNKHYQIGAEYNLLHISGTSAYDNLGIFAVNIGYKF